MFSSRSCGSGKVFSKLGGGESRIHPSYIADVTNKLRKIADFRSLTEDELSSKASELTSADKMWSVYFSAAVLDPARDRIERNLEGDCVEVLSREKVPIKLRFKPIQGSSQCSPLTSLLLKNYGSYRASLLVCNTVLLEWNTSSLVIPAGEPIWPDSVGTMGPLVSRTGISEPPHGGATATTPFTITDEIELVFEHSTSLKEQLDKLIGVIVKYNKNYIYHPISRNCQKFVSDALKVLDYPVHPKLEGKLVEYYAELKKKIRKPTFESHAELDEYVCQSCDTKVLEMEYLICQYFMFHITSLTESKNPKRWVCNERECHLSQLEKHIDLKDTIAYHVLSPLL